MYLLANVITMIMIPMQQALSPFQLPSIQMRVCVIKFHVARLMNTLMYEYT